MSLVLRRGELARRRGWSLADSDSIFRVCRS
jgi:hypothetical protein